MILHAALCVPMPRGAKSDLVGPTKPGRLSDKKPDAGCAPAGARRYDISYDSE
jgi:hypothetical protein